MDLTIPEEYLRLREAMRQYIEREALPAFIEASRNEYGEVDEEFMARFRRRSVDLGFYAIEMPEEFGGMNLGMLGSHLLREEYARHFAGYRYGPPVIAESVEGPSKMWLHANEEQKQKYLWPLVRGEKLTCFGVTEPGAGSDAQNIQTTAVKDGDNYVLNGTKHFISGGDRADFARIFAVTNKERRARGGVTCFIVEKGTPGFNVVRRQKTMGYGIAPAELSFEDCIVPAKNVLGEVGRGFYLAMEFLNEGRLQMAAVSTGAAETCLKLATSYAKQRVTFGLPLAERQAIQWMLADSAVELEAARGLAYRCCCKYDRGDDVRVDAAMAKVYATEMVQRVTDRAIQIHGGIGYTCDLPLEAIYRRIRVMRISEGSAEIMRILIARHVLKD